MICYNARVNLRSLVLAACLVLPAPALAAATVTTSATLTTGTSDVLVQTTAAGAVVPGNTGMKPGVAKPPVSKHPYFFAAYAVVWAVLFAYALWLGARIRSLEQKVASATTRSR